MPRKNNISRFTELKQEISQKMIWFYLSLHRQNVTSIRTVCYSV